MTDRRRRKMRVTGDDEYENEPPRSVPRQGVHESPAEEEARHDRMLDEQFEDLGPDRRTHISTMDYRKNMVEVDQDSLQRRRRINQTGTVESRVAPETAERLSLWNNVHASLKDDGTADEGLQDLAAGQMHRPKLMGHPSRGRNITRGQGDAGRRGFPRVRARARGVYGGRVISTRRRGTWPSRGPSVGIAQPLPRPPVVRLPPAAPALQALRSSTATSLNEGREHFHPRTEIPDNVRELRTNPYDCRLATPSDFMASLTTHGLLASASLLDGPAKDEPITGGAVQPSATGAAPMRTGAAADALFEIIEDDAANAPGPSTSIQADPTLLVGDLRGLEMTEGSAHRETKKDIMFRSPLVEPSTVIASLQRQEKTKEPGMWEAYMKTELHNLFPSAPKRAAQKHITEYYKATAVKETGQNIVQSTSEAVTVKGKGRANSSTSEVDEGPARKVPQSTAQQLQTTHDGFDPTNPIFTGPLSKSRWAPQARSASTIPAAKLPLPPHLAHHAPSQNHGVGDASKVQAGVINTPGPVTTHIVSQASTGQDVGPSRPAPREDPIRDVAPQQHGGARGGALAPNPTRQLPAATSAAVAGRGRGRGAAPTIPAAASSGFIKPGVGLSIWNRGGLSKKG